MYQARKAAINFLGEEAFKRRVESFRPIFTAVMKSKECSEIEATIEIMNAADSIAHNELSNIVTLAACVEIMEPSNGAVPASGVISC